MERNIYRQLLEWKESTYRKPLILNGARQVGKTYALEQFGKAHYEKVVYLNFEKEPELANFFINDLDPHRIIKVLNLYKNVQIEPEKTLLIFDEVQQCPLALISLKYFCEEAGEYHLAAAGSLLGIKLSTGSGFPVGKVDFLKLYPLNFFEFLTALGEDSLRHFLEDLIGFEPIPDPLHNKLIDLLKHYYFVGGMPEAVSRYVETEDVRKAREVQFAILDAYERDFSKHAPHDQVMKITAVWLQVHQQLAKENKKFVFSAIRQSARGRDYEEAIQWLIDAGLIHKSCRMHTPKLPISAYTDDHIFKLFSLDVGLLGAQSRLSAQTVIQGNQLFVEFKGALTENFVAQELISVNHDKLYYWTSPGTAEVDFTIPFEDKILPLEAKAGKGTNKKSLLSYANKYHPPQLSRVSLMNLKHDGDLYNYPLYLISRFKYISDIE